MQEFVSAPACGISNVGTDEIVLSFYGPRGGSRAIESVTPEAARKLASDLMRAAARFEFAGLEQMRNALRVIANQSVAPDWTAEQAIEFAKRHAREALA